MIYLGIDPGQSGGLAWLGGNTNHGEKMPGTERDTWIWFHAWLLDDSEAFAVIERVHSMPKQGVASSFKFGQSYGFLRGCLIASGIPFEEVAPHVWQREMGCLTKGNKNVSKARAQQLFPELRVTHAIADALLLAEYARRRHSLIGRG